ncbi:hypothetical protein A6M14_11730 [Acinetobacter sp. Ac_877]|uniref:hypothetical protein n=1 Tax=Acinetobacter portensis TaxID=1839785 RepID=UPI00128B1160|nr:hypothetical protein [Acinetobacter portensis]MPW42255.1 hypothetical protein [Acinetobacter portensis]
MAKFKHVFYSIFVFLFGFLVLGCQPNAQSTENNTMKQQPYILHFGPQGFQDFAKYNLGDTDNHPVASFRSLRFSPPNLGQVQIENGASSLVIDHVFHVLGTSFHQEDGIEGIDIDAGLNKEEFVTPNQAYQGYVNLMQRVNKAGWKNYFYESDPRILKEDNFRYLKEWGEVIDPSYIFSYEEWKKVISTSVGNSFGYLLYAHGLLLSISIEQKNVTEDGKEQYLVRYSFDTIRYTQRNLMSDTANNIDPYSMSAEELRQAFEKEVKRKKESRAMDEQEAKAQGYRIDEHYVGPDVWQYVK